MTNAMMKRFLAYALAALVAVQGFASPVAAQPSRAAVVLSSNGGCALAPLAGASLDLQFTTGCATTNGTGSSIPSLITTTRASTGYAQTSAGVLVPFASNVPRITDQGLLVEEARTNLALRSQKFDNASWTKNDTTVAADATTAPDGTLTADKINETATTAQHTVTQSVTLSTVFTLSAYFKAAERTVVWLYADHVGAGKYFNLGTGAVGGTIGTGANITASSITPLANGWYRCTVSYVAAGGAATVRAALTTADGTTSYLGVAGSGAYVWGLQVEAAAFGTSYIPTVGSTVTRAADVITLTGAAATAALAAKAAYFETSGSVTGIGASRFATCAGGAYYLFGTSTTVLPVSASGSGPSVTIGGSVTQSGLVKAAFGVDSSGMASIANGGTPNTNATAWTGNTGTVTLGDNGTGIRSLNGYLRRIAFGAAYNQFSGLTA